jgi:hypothetical protein
MFCLCRVCLCHFDSKPIGVNGCFCSFWCSKTLEDQAMAGVSFLPSQNHQNSYDVWFLWISKIHKRCAMGRFLLCASLNSKRPKYRFMSVLLWLLKNLHSRHYVWFLLSLLKIGLLRQKHIDILDVWFLWVFKMIERSFHGLVSALLLFLLKTTMRMSYVCFFLAAQTTPQETYVSGFSAFSAQNLSITRYGRLLCSKSPIS